VKEVADLLPLYHHTIAQEKDLVRDDVFFNSKICQLRQSPSIRRTKVVIVTMTKGEKRAQ
jgi:murein L,D-transpeptidase YafK